MDELRITVKIAERPYRLKVRKDEEETIRKAARLINEKLKEYADNYAFNDKQDLLSMVAILYASKAIGYEEEVKGKDTRLKERLTEIERVLSEQIKS